jgi:hypothetical protein
MLSVIKEIVLTNIIQYKKYEKLQFYDFDNCNKILKDFKNKQYPLYKTIHFYERHKKFMPLLSSKNITQEYVITVYIREEHFGPLTPDWTIKHVKYMTFDLFKSLIDNDISGNYLMHHFKKLTEKMKIYALNKNGELIRNIGKPSLKLILIALKQNGYVIRHFTNQTNQMKWIAINFNIATIRYIENQTEEMDILYHLNHDDCTKYNEKYLAIIKKQLSII